MKSTWAKLLIAANLVALVALAFVYPHPMVSPGALVAGHAALATDCFACHAPWRGAASDLCVACHALPDIGLRTTRGVPLSRATSNRDGTAARAVRTAFHQELTEQDCMACHSDHQGPKLTQRSRKPFSHGLLRAAVQDRCESCHAKPTDKLHEALTGPCLQCHTADRWKPATFKHGLLAPAVLNKCEACHKAPADTLHQQVRGSCQTCHSSEHWKPATYDHDKLFVLDRDHNVECVTCHLRNDYRSYTCYGCHEHTPANVRREHEKEGIANFDNCVECHRSADEEPRGKDGKGERKRSGKDHGRD